MGGHGQQFIKGAFHRHLEATREPSHCTTTPHTERSTFWLRQVTTRSPMKLTSETRKLLRRVHWRIISRKVPALVHVPRNVRLALFYIDIVQSYVLWKTTPVMAVTGEAVAFEWEVGGAITVDTTQLYVSRRIDLKDANVSEPQSGVTRWYHPAMGDTGTSQVANNGVFSERMAFPSSGVYFVQAYATVDQNWAEQPETPSPNLKPQTHVVNARTNAKWFYQANNKTVRGRLEWVSP